VGLIAAFSLVFGSERFFYFGQDISGRSLYLTAVWFILGILFGRAHSTRPILWGIICWFAGAVGLAAGTLSGIF